MEVPGQLCGARRNVYTKYVISFGVSCRSLTLILFPLLSSYCPSFIPLPADASVSLVQFPFQDFLSPSQCRGPWPPPCRVRLHLLLKKLCDSGFTNTKELKDQDLTSNPPITLGFSPHIG